MSFFEDNLDSILVDVSFHVDVSQPVDSGSSRCDTGAVPPTGVDMNTYLTNDDFIEKMQEDYFDMHPDDRDECTARQRDFDKKVNDRRLRGSFIAELEDITPGVSLFPPSPVPPVILLGPFLNGWTPQEFPAPPPTESDRYETVMEKVSIDLASHPFYQDEGIAPHNIVSKPPAPPSNTNEVTLREMSEPFNEPWIEQLTPHQRELEEMHFYALCIAPDVIKKFNGTGRRRRGYFISLHGSKRCPVGRCKHKARNDKDLEKHIHVHFPDAFFCPECMKSFARKSSLVRHFKHSECKEWIDDCWNVHDDPKKKKLNIYWLGAMEKYKPMSARCFKLISGRARGEKIY